MENTMITKKIKDLKKASYILLTMLSSAEAGPTISLSRDYIDQPVVGGSIKVPYEKESLIDTLEKRVKLLFEDYDTQEDEAQKDIQSPAMDVNEERYARLKSKIIDKYERDRPELTRFRTSSSKKNGTSIVSLEKASQDFAKSVEQLRIKLEQDNKNLQESVETAVNVGSSLLEGVIDNKASDPAKKLLLVMLDKAKREVFNFLRQ